MQCIVNLIDIYYIQKNWTFKYKESGDNNLPKKFALAVLVTYILNSALLYIFIEIVGIEEIYSKILQIIISTLFGFTINCKFVFKKGAG